MPFAYRARLVRKIRGAEYHIRVAIEYIATCRASLEVDHPGQGKGLIQVMRDLDIDRHNVIVAGSGIFYHARMPQYTRATLTAILRRARPIPRYKSEL